MKWQEVKSLHLEISALCNAVCPQCARYPTASYYEHPNISHDHVWTLEQVKARLPAEDLINIKEIMLNGTVGDFITNKDALEIVKHLIESNNARVKINTNGSARSIGWWAELATTPNLTVNFALDGLEDTHHLYRRNTNWQQIIKNATAYIQAGGNAEWIMTIFEHNKHQIDDCSKLAKQFGFAKFHARHSDRTIVPARDRQGKFTHWLEPASDTPTSNNRISIDNLIIKEAKLKAGKLNPAIRQDNNIALPSLDNCDSLKLKQIYIGGNWFVTPCCFLGAISFTREYDHRYANFVDGLAEAGFTLEELYVTDKRSVRDIVNTSFDWIYNRITTERALTGCFNHCHPNKANYRLSRANIITK